MRVLLLAAAAAFVASFAGLSTASAEPPSAVLIQIHPNPSAGFLSGSWEASGAIADVGLYEKTFGASAPPGRPPFTFGPFREEFLLTSLRGTLTIREEARLTAHGQTGEWQIASGTGDYADTSGHGTLTFSGNPATGVFTLALTGVASKVAP